VYNVCCITDLTDCLGYPLLVNIEVILRNDLFLSVESVDREIALLTSPMSTDLLEAIDP
jgi:hypothetical protein